MGRGIDMKNLYLKWVGTSPAKQYITDRVTSDLSTGCWNWNLSVDYGFHYSHILKLWSRGYRWQNESS